MSCRICLAIGCRLMRGDAAFRARVRDMGRRWPAMRWCSWRPWRMEYTSIASARQAEQLRQRLPQLSVHALGQSGASTLVHASCPSSSSSSSSGAAALTVGQGWDVQQPGEDGHADGVDPSWQSFPPTPPIRHRHTAVGRASERGHLHALLYKRSNLAKHSPDALRTSAASLPTFLYTITWWQ